MGWAIRRADGTYRGWNGAAQDDTLLPGETWEQHDTPPEITTPLADVRQGVKNAVDALGLLEAALTLTLLDLINVERTARGATTIGLAAFRTLVKNKIDGLTP